jgi:hypothetical protein
VDLKEAEKLSNIVVKAKPKRRSKRKKTEWVAFPYNRVLELARVSRDPLLAALAELHHLQFRSWEKDKPLKFPSTVFYQLGFSRHAKIRALKALEKAGWVSVKWFKRKSPIVEILRGFYFGS